MSRAPARAIGWLFASQSGPPERLLPRWLFLRAMAAIYFSAFFSLLFQIRGLIGPNGILPAQNYLRAIAQSLGPGARWWYAPTLLWWSSSNGALSALCWVGLAASVLLFLNLWPRGMLTVCFLSFLSFVAAAQSFSGYQSDGMLLEAGFICLFFAPAGFRPGLGREHPASRASLYLLRWEWFRIYFESGAVKLLSHDPQWRNFTAMDEYYQNGPLPTWVGWYVQHLPHWFHAGAVYGTLALELGLVWMMFLPRRWRIACFFIVTAWQIPVILTANYTFLNYLVLCLGVLLLDDAFLRRVWPWKQELAGEAAGEAAEPVAAPAKAHWRETFDFVLQSLKLSASTVLLGLIFYVTTVEMIWMFWQPPLLPSMPVDALEPFRIANRYGLFAVMTRGRYEIEFQGSNDGQNWTVYPFRYKPQALDQAPRIYAPYQPRFDWNLWFASLASWSDDAIVPNTEVRLLQNDKDVLTLFAGNPFAQAPPQQIRVVLWQYWFTSMEEKRKTGNWWRREYLGLYAPTLQLMPDGRVQALEMPDVPPRN
jgi:hypothetical protein